MKMSRNSGNASKTKKSILEGSNAAKSNRKSFKLFSESSSISSNRNSSAQSDDDEVNADATFTKQQQFNCNDPFESRELLIKKLQGQVRELRHKVKILEESVENKDYSLGTMAREKERAIGEIKRLERSNKQLRQQLNDERNYYLEEKEKFCEEMTRYKKRLQKAKSDVKKPKDLSKWTPILPISQQSLRWHFNNEKGDFTDNNSKSFALLKSSKSQGLTGSKKQINPLGSFSCSDSQIQKTFSLESLHLYDGNDQTLQVAALKTENAKLRSIVCERDERNYELCLRFLRMKHCKNDIRTRFQDLENEYLQVITNLMEKIDEARQEFNFIIDQKFKKPLHSTNAMYLRLVQRNSRMAFENASLRLENQGLKKELKKHQSEVSEYESGKIDQVLVADAQNSKGTFDDEKLKRTKKNVNFKEIRTIYQRSLTFKNSDTDSNYMSKMRVTVPSNESLTDLKSNESAVEGGGDETKHEKSAIEYPLQATSLPDDILNKIFKKIDTSSCQTVDSFKSNKTRPIINIKGSGEKLGGIKNNDVTQVKDNLPLGNTNLQNSIPEDTKFTDGTKGKMPNLTDSSTPCESKESVLVDKRNSSNGAIQSSNEFLSLSTKFGRMNAAEKKAYLKLRRQNQAVTMRSRQEILRSLNKDTENAIRWFDYFQDGRLTKHRNKSVAPENHRSRIKDSCGLQEKLDVSSQELPKMANSKTQTDRISDKKKTEGKGDLHTTCSNHEIAEVHQKEENFRSSETSCTLIINTTKKFSKTDQACMQDINFHTAKTYRIENNSSTLIRDLCSDVTESLHNPQASVVPSESPRSRKPESSKRFSHRLISSSPEKLRSILTESQLEACYRMAPIIVGHATTEIDRELQSTEANNDIVLKLVIPAASVEKSQISADNEVKTKSTLEKETSISGLNPVTSEKLPELSAEAHSSDIRIPVSNLPTSTSTIDILDLETLNDRSNIILRTFSAPGLLESSWLDPYTVCEMRDCSTNT